MPISAARGNAWDFTIIDADCTEKSDTWQRCAVAGATLEELYRPLYLISTPFVWTNHETAELIKYASNAFLATKITFINQVANLPEAVSADVHTVARSMGMDGRISPKFLHPGPGYGGSCFPKDTKALAVTGTRYGVDMSLVSAVIVANEAQKTRTAEKVIRLLTGDAHGMATGAVVAILGVAFKAETADIRESPAIRVVRDLLGADARVRVHDPKALTEWNEYRNMDLARAASLMREPPAASSPCEGGDAVGGTYGTVDTGA